ncbi:MAG: DNA mismatch repair endonuclease MutL, partial [Gemmatimonadota bacterium]
MPTPAASSASDSMSRTIHILPDSVANQIAAGEVVERPASVVKELVENAIDAGARRIDVRLERGGKRLVRVSDDGWGMGREDAILSLDRHATSKISETHDLQGVPTFGFRGEALPSIASVARFTLETRLEDDGIGTRIRVRGGTIEGVDDVARTRGTTVTVENLFFNAPARAKFLRTPAVETRAVSEALTPLALAHPAVAITLVSDDRTLMELPEVPDVIRRISGLWGEEAASALIPVAFREGEHVLCGVVQRPDAVRPGFRRAYLFHGERPFREPALLRAAERGYRTTIPEGHRPWLILFLDAPAGSVDVNVHPTKAEVRFRDRSVIEDLVEGGVRIALETEDSAATMDQVHQSSGLAVRERAAGRSPSSREEPAEPADGPGPPPSDSQIA